MAKLCSSTKDTFFQSANVTGGARETAASHLLRVSLKARLYPHPRLIPVFLLFIQCWGVSILLPGTRART